VPFRSNPDSRVPECENENLLSSAIDGDVHNCRWRRIHRKTERIGHGAVARGNYFTTLPKKLEETAVRERYNVFAKRSQPRANSTSLIAVTSPLGG
jgi:hypothetical protein